MDFKRAYRILEIDEAASFSEIKQAYRDLASIWHPDRHSNNSRLTEKALQKMKEINAAYDLLSSWHAEIDKNKSREQERHEEVIVKCRRCGAQNRILNISGAIFKCGKCHHNLFDEQSYSDNSERVLCGDGECIGVIRNGRCIVCGKTLEEGIREDEIKSKLYQKKHDENREEKAKEGKTKKVFKYFLISALVIFIIYAIQSDKSSSPPRGPKPYIASPERAFVPKFSYVRPTTAPNGEPWPIVPDYVRGYHRTHANGLSTVTVDNSQNDADVFVKLVSLDGPQTFPVRVFFIPAHGRFTLSKVTAGSYDIRYRDLSSGQLSRSEAFSLEEISSYDGTQYSNITMTLYKVQHGNMQSYVLSEADF
jgi:hypothetical protein